ncbi:hypothetical protein EYF80_061183 [Liparis tanakae]|uniref:Uncharacterized protein n=1 Tax=Liparis tanakae TaxID=230148 RepID=A0A4Z2EJB3_9TELE|nr:hypothetical protein EYF80_061183 [Liparis tanakae]
METAPEGNQYPAAASVTYLSYRVDRPFLFLIRDEATKALDTSDQMVALTSQKTTNARRVLLLRTMTAFCPHEAQNPSSKY